jgi:drug/metabolite transporter (DMT)-like permease
VESQNYRRAIRIQREKCDIKYADHHCHNRREEKNKVQNNAYILLIFCTLFWGGNAVAGKYLAGSIPPATIFFMRLAISLLIVLPIVFPLLKREAPVARKNIKLLFILAITGVIGYNLFSYWAVNYTSAIYS